MHINKKHEQGQSLVEVVVSLAIAVIIVVAFTNVTIASIRDAQFAKNENQATRIAQKTLELVRAVRDQNNDVHDDDAVISDPTTLSNDYTFNNLYGENMYSSLAAGDPPGQCFKLKEDTLVMTQVSSGLCSAVNKDILVVDKTDYTRRIVISNEVGLLTRLTISVTVSWTDGKGTHSTEAKTYLTQW